MVAVSAEGDWPDFLSTVVAARGFAVCADTNFGTLHCVRPTVCLGYCIRDYPVI